MAPSPAVRPDTGKAPLWRAPKTTALLILEKRRVCPGRHGARRRTPFLVTVREGAASTSFGVSDQ